MFSPYVPLMNELFKPLVFYCKGLILENWNYRFNFMYSSMEDPYNINCLAQHQYKGLSTLALHVHDDVQPKPPP